MSEANAMFDKMMPDLATYHIYHGGELPPNQAIAYEYWLAGNGLYLRAENRFVEALIPIAPVAVRGLPSLSPKITLRTPKLPAALLTQVAHDARAVRGRGNCLLEALYHFHYQDGHVRVIKPPQQATTTSVVAQSGDTSDLILELHSHGRMGAFFSAVDDKDEVGMRWYGVIGRLDTKPEMVLRLGVYGYRMTVPVATLFSGTESVSYVLESFRTN